MMSSIPVADLKGNTIGRTIYRPSIIAIAFIFAKLWMGAESTLPPADPGKQSKKLELLDRVEGNSILDL